MEIPLGPILKEVEDLGDDYYGPEYGESMYNLSFLDLGLDNFQLCEIPLPVDVTAQVLTTVSSVAGLLFNCVVIYVMAALNESKKTGIHWVMKQFFVSNVIFFTFSFLQMVNEHHGKWLMGAAMCKLDEAFTFTSRAAGIIFLTIANVVGIVYVLDLPFNRIRTLPQKHGKLWLVLKYAFAILFVWLPCALVNLPLYKFKNVNDCKRCVLEFPIEIEELCPMLGLNSTTCGDIMSIFMDDDVTPADGTNDDYIEGDFYYSGDEFDTSEFGKILENNITKMAEMTACKYDEPRSFFLWLYASFVAFFCAPLPILLSFFLLWFYDVTLRKPKKLKDQNKASALNVVGAVDILFFICWTPWNAIHMKKAHSGLGDDGNRCASVIHFARFSALFCSVAAPVMYACLTTDFRSRMLRAIDSSTNACYHLLNMRERRPSKSSHSEIGDRTSNSDDTKDSSPLTDKRSHAGFEPSATPV